MRPRPRRARVRGRLLCGERVFAERKLGYAFTATSAGCAETKDGEQQEDEDTER